ncbi:hypothetical protein [Streptomyces venezuelae]|uniref:Lipoprotein n=2 Tax=Streptomyces TaxID=1883 RepID=A0A5P2BEQ0_STRVZ|nr:hypothetical protein [Streptomyces venezuelae]MYY84637.1 hypothetical protein [Streptomyces sp. SID335]MYZ16586.1 hypothetical protein [Streptomyces sp. SID337]QES26799.1 hypothetical protein DEJ47_10215 [Streptomyces venezuelae]
MTRTVGAARCALSGMAAGALMMVMGCGSGGDGTPRTASGSLEQLAAEAGCRPDVRTDAAELRQATCQNGARRYVLVTFTNARGQAEWLDEANDYGGTYLVGGSSWVAVGAADDIAALHDRLGGTVVDAAGRHGGNHHGHPEG